MASQYDTNSTKLIITEQYVKQNNSQLKTNRCCLTNKLSELVYIYETKNHGIQVLAPDINESYNHVAAIDWNIRLWFLGIKGIGFDIWEFIQQERQQNWQYVSLEDFLKRCDKAVNKKSLEWLITIIAI